MNLEVFELYHLF